MAKKGKGGKGKSKGFFGAIGSFLGSIPIVAKAKKAGKALWKEAKKKKNQLKKFLKRAKKKLGKFFTKARKKGRKLKKWAVRWVKRTGKAAVLWVKNTAKKAKQAYQQTKKVYTQAKQAVKDIKAAAKEAVKVYKSIDKMEPQKTTKEMSNKEKLEVMAKNFLLQQVQSNKGKLDATIDVGKSTIQDIKQLVTGEALDDLAYAVSHPVQTAKSMGKAIKDSYEKDVLNGNAYSKSYWLTNAKLTVATSLIGTKGIGPVAKVGKLPDAPQANVPKVTPNTAVNLKSDVLSKVEEVKQQLRQLRTPSYELAGVNVGRITDNGTVGKNTPPSNPKPSTSSKPPQNSSNSKPVEATKGTGKVQTGGRELSVDEYLKRLDEADDMYESFRKSKTDVNSIAKNTGMNEQRVQRIKDHLLFKEHIKEHGVGRFDSDYEIAQAWDRLQKGTHKKNDIDLLNHELFESRFEGIFKTDYRTAHDKTVESGRPWHPPEEE